MFPPSSKPRTSAYLAMSTAVGRISLHERRGCSGASKPVPAGDDSSLLRSAFISPLIFCSSNACVSGISLTCPGNLLQAPPCPCLVSPWEHNTAAVVVIMQTIITGENRTPAASVAARFPALAGSSPPTYFQYIFETRVKIYFDYAVFGIIDRIHSPLNPALPLSQYLTPIETIVSPSGCKPF